MTTTPEAIRANHEGNYSNMRKTGYRIVAERDYDLEGRIIAERRRRADADMSEVVGSAYSTKAVELAGFVS